MIQEDKELLLKDISTRLPYRVKMECKWKTPSPNRTYGMMCELDSFLLDQIYNMNDSDVPFDEFKPYLFPMSSMTEEQKEEYYYIVNYISPDDTENLPEGEFVYMNQIEQLLHFYHINHLDYRGLIPKGLALDATGLNIY